MEDEKLIKRCQAGDKEAFQELIRKYHPYVFKFLIKMSENDHIAEDLAQETFLKMIRNIEKFDINGKAKFSTYIMTISKNCYIDYLRKERRLVLNMPLDENPNLVDEYANVESDVLNRIAGENILKKLETLSEEQKIAIKLKYIEGMTLKEIAEKLNVEPKTVKSRIHNGVVKLRNIFLKEEQHERD